MKSNTISGRPLAALLAAPLALGAAIAVTLAGSGAAHAQQNDTLAKIKETGVISLGHRESSIPFSYNNGREVMGYSHEIMLAIVDKVKSQLQMPNLQVRLMPITSQNRISLMQNGTIDLECGSTTNNTARGKDVQFAINHFYTGTRLLVKKSSGIRNYADLNGKTVATTTGTTNFQVLRKYIADKNLKTDIIAGKDHDDSKLLVETGRAVAFGMDDILLYGLKAADRNPADWDVVGEALQVEPYACMMRKDDPKFQQLVNGVIGTMMKNGEFEKLYAKWFTSPIPPRGVNLNFPMAPELKENLKAQSDKPAT